MVTHVHGTNEFETKEYKPRNKLDQKMYMYMWYFRVRTLDIRFACDVHTNYFLLFMVYPGDNIRCQSTMHSRSKIK